MAGSTSSKRKRLPIAIGRLWLNLRRFLIGGIGDTANFKRTYVVKGLGPGGTAAFPRDADRTGLSSDLRSPRRTHDVLIAARDDIEGDLEAR